jgi:hypothetical protein
MILLHVAEGRPDGKVRGSTKLGRLSGGFWNERHCFLRVTSSQDQDAVGVYIIRRKEKEGVGGKK